MLPTRALRTLRLLQYAGVYLSILGNSWSELYFLYLHIQFCSHIRRPCGKESGRLFSGGFLVRLASTHIVVSHTLPLVLSTSWPIKGIWRSQPSLFYDMTCSGLILYWYVFWVDDWELDSFLWFWGGVKPQVSLILVTILANFAAWMIRLSWHPWPIFHASGTMWVASDRLTTFGRYATRGVSNSLQNYFLDFV